MPRRTIRQLRAPILASVLMGALAVAALALLARGSMRIADAFSNDSAKDALLTYFPLATVLRAELLREEGEEKLYLVPGEEESSAATLWCAPQGPCRIVAVEPLHQ